MHRTGCIVWKNERRSFLVEIPFHGIYIVNYFSSDRRVFPQVTNAVSHTVRRKLSSQRHGFSPEGGYQMRPKMPRAIPSIFKPAKVKRSKTLKKIILTVAVPCPMDIVGYRNKSNYRCVDRRACKMLRVGGLSANKQSSVTVNTGTTSPCIPIDPFVRHFRRCRI